MMKKNKYTGKTKVEAIENAKIALQELEDNLYIKELEVKNGLFNKKVEIEVIRKDDVIEFLKEYVKEIIQNMGLNNVNLEVKKQPENVAITVYADNNSILIGKNGRTLEALTTITKQAIYKELGEYFHFTLDVSEYKIQQEKRLISLAKRVAREVASSKIPAKLDPMNSYERRIIHTALSENKKVMTESEGEHPNRCVVIKPREEDK
ncbi:MAG: KH domain-containing protein [Firmicutes bacterium]|nr:KH domain-containing protein [Bacillota bacterium]